MYYNYLNYNILYYFNIKMQLLQIDIHPLWYICIFIRLIISLLPLIYNYLSENTDKKLVIDKISLITKYIILIIGIGFLYKAIFGSNNEIQVKKVFWHETRIVHSLLFITAGLYFNNYKLSGFLLFTSILFSIIYRFRSQHFK